VSRAAHLEAPEQASGERVRTAARRLDAFGPEHEERMLGRGEHLLVHHAIAAVDAGVAAPRVDADLACGRAALGVERDLAAREREGPTHGVETRAEREADLGRRGVEHEAVGLGSGGLRGRRREAEEPREPAPEPAGAHRCGGGGGSSSAPSATSRSMSASE
jgi:hypothetical protein